MFFYMTGGLASPPDSRNNSPMAPMASTSAPRSSSKLSSLSLLMDSCELEEEVSQTICLESEQRSSGLSEVEEDDQPTVVQSEKPSSDSMEVCEEVDGMIGVECEKLLSDATKVEEAVDGMVLVQSSNPVLDLLEDGELEDGEGNLVVGILSKEPSSDSEEYKGNQLVSAVDDEDGAMIGVKEANPVIRVESNEMPLKSNSLVRIGPPLPGRSSGHNLESNSSVRLAAPFEHRRSSCLAPEKSKPSLKVAEPTTPSTGKRKEVFKKNVILLEVSVSNNPPAKLYQVLFRPTLRMKITDIAKATVGFSLFIYPTTV